MTQGPDKSREELEMPTQNDVIEEVYPSILVTKKDELEAGRRAAAKMLKQMRED